MTDEINGCAFGLSEGTHYSRAVVAISALIMQAERSMKMEQTSPGFDPDRMDDKIKHYADRVEKLRDIRENFETIMNTPSP